MKQDNKGFSLIELVIAISLLAIVSAMLLNFMTTGSTMFRRVSTDVSLQMESQVAMTQLREYVIDCNDTLTYDQAAHTLTVLNSGAEEHVFTWDPSDGIIRYNGDPLTVHVSAFHLTQVDGAVEITLAFSHIDEKCEVTQTVALRNDSVIIDFS